MPELSIEIRKASFSQRRIAASALHGQMDHSVRTVNGHGWQTALSSPAARDWLSGTGAHMQVMRPIMQPSGQRRRTCRIALMPRIFTDGQKHVMQSNDENVPPSQHQPLLARTASADSLLDQQGAQAPATPQLVGARTPRSTFKQRVAMKMAELEATLRRDGTRRCRCSVSSTHVLNRRSRSRASTEQHAHA